MIVSHILKVLLKQMKSDPIMFSKDLITLLFGEKSFEKNSLLRNAQLNEWGLHLKRVKWVHKLAQKRRRTLEATISSDDAEFFYQNGYIVKENFLHIDDFSALKIEAEQHTFDTREMLQGNTVTRRMALDHHMLKNLPALSQFFTASDWNKLIDFTASFKVQPMNYIQVIFSKVNQDEPDPQTYFHSDTFYSSAKAWLFLTDVDESIGPFMYVPGSHKVDEKRLAWEKYKAMQIVNRECVDVLSNRGSFRITEEELQTFGFEQPIKFNVKANTLLIADTFGFHARGESAETAVRSEIWAYARRNPMLPFVSGHFLALPWIRARTVTLYWQALDYLESKKLKRSPWRKVGKLKAYDATRIKSKADQDSVS